MSILSSSTPEAGAGAPLLSVIILNHNGSQILDVIRASVAAVLAQDYPAIELIIVDDNSSDGSDEVLAELHDAGFRTVGLDSEGPEELEPAMSSDRIALVLGAEGKGLRQKTRETVDALARLDMPGAIRSLNVSNAAAVAMYAARKHLGA